MSSRSENAEALDLVLTAVRELGEPARFDEALDYAEWEPATRALCDPDTPDIPPCTGEPSCDADMPTLSCPSPNRADQ